MKKEWGEKKNHKRLTKIKEAFFFLQKQKNWSQSGRKGAAEKRLLSGSETLFGGLLAVTQRGAHSPAGDG